MLFLEQNLVYILISVHYLDYAFLTKDSVRCILCPSGDSIINYLKGSFEVLLWEIFESEYVIKIIRKF